MGLFYRGGVRLDSSISTLLRPDALDDDLCRVMGASLGALAMKRMLLRRRTDGSIAQYSYSSEVVLHSVRCVICACGSTKTCRGILFVSLAVLPTFFLLSFLDLLSLAGRSSRKSCRSLLVMSKVKASVGWEKARSTRLYLC